MWRQASFAVCCTSTRSNARHYFARAAKAQCCFASTEFISLPPLSPPPGRSFLGISKLFDPLVRPTLHTMLGLPRVRTQLQENSIGPHEQAPFRQLWAPWKRRASNSARAASKGPEIQTFQAYGLCAATCRNPLPTGLQRHNAPANLGWTLAPNVFRNAAAICAAMAPRFRRPLTMWCAYAISKAAAMSVANTNTDWFHHVGFAKCSLQEARRVHRLAPLRKPRTQAGNGRSVSRMLLHS